MVTSLLSVSTEPWRIIYKPLNTHPLSLITLKEVGGQVKVKKCQNRKSAETKFVGGWGGGGSKVRKTNIFISECLPRILP